MQVFTHGASIQEWLRLVRSDGIGPTTVLKLLRKYGSPAASLDALARHQKPDSRIKIASAAQIDDELAALQNFGARVLTLSDSSYPSSLRNVVGAPPVLTAKGDVSLLSRPSLAIVGTREASAHGRIFTEQLARDLGHAGYVITSGLARGIDTAAHRGALATGTIAVLGTGIDQPYPAENKALYDQISAEGLIISEMPFGTPPAARNFPRRNRIIAGLSLATIVVEAKLGSGAMITARYALEQEREIFAVPGFPADPRAAGPNRLLKDGARLVEHAQDILDITGPAHQATQLREPVHVKSLLTPLAAEKQIMAKTAPRPASESPADTTTSILALLGPTPIGVDELSRQCQFSAPILRGLLLDMELAGMVERHPGDRVSRRP